MVGVVTMVVGVSFTIHVNVVVLRQVKKQKKVWQTFSYRTPSNKVGRIKTKLI